MFRKLVLILAALLVWGMARNADAQCGVASSRTTIRTRIVNRPHILPFHIPHPFRKGAAACG